MPDLTFQRASELAQVMEIADKNTQDFRPGSSSEVKSISREVLRKGRGKFVDRSKTQLSQTGSKGLKCFRCAGSHAPNLCKFKDERCYVCSKNFVRRALQ